MRGLVVRFVLLSTTYPPANEKKLSFVLLSTFLANSSKTSMLLFLYQQIYLRNIISLYCFLYVATSTMRADLVETVSLIAGTAQLAVSVEQVKNLDISSVDLMLIFLS